MIFFYKKLGTPVNGNIRRLYVVGGDTGDHIPSDETWVGQIGTIFCIYIYYIVQIIYILFKYYLVYN